MAYLLDLLTNKRISDKNVEKIKAFGLDWVKHSLKTKYGRFPQLSVITPMGLARIDNSFMSTADYAKDLKNATLAQVLYTMRKKVDTCLSTEHKTALNWAIAELLTKNTVEKV